MKPSEKPYTLEASYDRIAEHYAQAFYDELQGKPFDRQLLDRFAESVRDKGRVCDLGCGPGQIARYLRDHGVDACGIDLSGEMVRCAQRLNPDIPFEVGNMLALPLPDASLAGVACFYAIIHLSLEEAPQALKEIGRVLQPGGRLLLAFHGGEGETHVEEWFGEPVAVSATFFAAEEMAGYLVPSGFHVEQMIERDPYPFEYQSRRIYILARKPATPV